MQNILPLNLNAYQLRSEFIAAKIIIDACGRGTGKTTRMARIFKKLSKTMPGATASMSGRSYMLLIDKILPELNKGLILNGLKPGYDYILGVKKKPSWFEDPLTPRSSYERGILFKSGFYVHLNSLDKNNSNRGSSYDFNALDEGVDNDFNKYMEEVAPANRGNIKLFEKHPLHHSYLITSSKPIGHKGRWFTDFGDYYAKDGNDYTLRLKNIIRLKLDFIEEKDFKLKIKILQEIIELKKTIIWYKSDKGVFYQEADAFDNWENVGFEYFNDQKEIYKSAPLKYRTEMLNESVTEALNGFYPNFDDSKHIYYNTEDENYIATLGINANNRNLFQRNCLWDIQYTYDGIKNYDNEAELLISQDYGDSCNFLVIGQFDSKYNQLNVINEFVVTKPLIMDDVLKLFTEYYKPHKWKNIKYFFDHTGNSGVANDYYTLAERARNIFIDADWNVEMMTKGGAFNPDVKYQDINRILIENSANTQEDIKVRINGDRCIHLKNSIQFAGVKILDGKIKKDKDSEKQEGFPQEDATHGSDAFDILVCSVNELDFNSAFFSITTN
ncbi:MAG: hypothetical protein ACKVPJ_13480 [Chitinophagales bacterium]